MSREIVKLPKEIEDWIKSVSQEVITPDGKSYYFIPYWFREADLHEDFSFEMHHLNEIPKELLEAIKSLRE